MALLPLTLYSNNALLVLNGTSLHTLTPFWLSTDDIKLVDMVYDIRLRQTFQVRILELQSESIIKNATLFNGSLF